MAEPATPDSPEPPVAPTRARLHEIIFEAETRAGLAFDIVLMVLILLSVVAVCLDSVVSIRTDYHGALVVAEWVFTVLFTIEYVLRIACVRRPVRYIFSFYGIVDLLAILPTYLSLFIAGSQSLLVIRMLRMLRVFRVLKLARMLGEATALRRALWASRAKITVFLTLVLCVVVIMGTAVHLIEGESNEAFSSIPASIYWAIVTMTTVGYGDIAPQTPLGRAVAAAVMIVGYSFIVVPTGIISAEIAMGAARHRVSTEACPSCAAEGHDADAEFCRKCGAKL